MASRAVDLAAHVGHCSGDQHRVETAALQHLLDVRGALDEGAVAVLLDDQVGLLDLEVGEDFVALVFPRQRELPARGTLRPDHFVGRRPARQSLVGVGGLDPDHRAAGVAHRLRQTVDIGHDLVGHLAGGMAQFRHHEAVLHIDHDQRGLPWDRGCRRCARGRAGPPPGRSPIAKWQVCAWRALRRIGRLCGDGSRQRNADYSPQNQAKDKKSRRVLRK